MQLREYIGTTARAETNFHLFAMSKRPHPNTHDGTTQNDQKEASGCKSHPLLPLKQSSDQTDQHPVKIQQKYS